MKYNIGEVYAQSINDIATVIHQANVDAGWWQDLYDVIDVVAASDIGIDEKRNMIEKVKLWFEMSKAALIHSEVSEMVEGMRKRTMDNHLKHRPASEVEGADTLIRLLDLMAARGDDIGFATDEKFAYNQERADHKREAREAHGGKLV